MSRRLKKFFASTLPILVTLILLFAALYLAADATTSESGLGDYYEAVFWVAGLALAALTLLIMTRIIRLLRRVRRDEPGSRLTLRLVLLFVMLTLPPALIVYWFSIDFLRRGVDSWFDSEVYSAMGDAREVGRTLLDLQERQHRGQIETLAARLVDQPSASARSTLRQMLRETEARELSLLDANGNVLASINSEGSLLPDLPSNFVLVQARATGTYVETEGEGDGRKIRTLAEIQDTDLDQVRLLQGIFSVTSVDRQVDNIGRMTDRMNQLAFLRDNLKRSFLLILSLVLLLSVLLAVLLGLNTARRLVSPIGRLSAATRAIAAGDYDRRLEVPSHNDELGFLVDSFNRMTEQISRASDDASSSRQEAEDRRDYLETVLGRLSSGVISVDQQQRVATANQAAAEILGVPLRALRQTRLAELPDRDARLQPFVTILRDHLDGAGGDWRQQVKLFDDTGREQILMLRGAPLTAAASAAFASGHVVVVNDLTDLVKAQREAAWGEVARRLAHEVKNPLTPIQLAAERLRHKYLKAMPADESAVMDKATRTIVAQVEALKKLVDAFSDYARAPSLQRRPVKLSQLIDDVLALYESANADWQIERDWPDHEPAVLVDADRIRQLLHNLIKNAAEAVVDKSLRMSFRITLDGVGVPEGSSSERPSLTLSLTDNGPGLPADLAARVFEPYATNKPRGSGLGLAIVKRIAEEHDARISASNTGHGARFELSIPLQRAESKRQRAG